MNVWMHSSAISLNKTIISDIFIFIIIMIIIVVSKMHSNEAILFF